MMRIAIFALCSVMTAAAADVAGKWNMTAVDPSGREIKLELELKDSAGKLSGVISSSQGSLDVTDAKLEGKELSFKIPTGDATYAVKVNVDGDSMKGTWSAPNGSSGAMTGARPGAAAAASGGNSAIVGKWNATAVTAGGQEMKVTFNITETGGKLGGTVTTADGETADLSDTKFENNELTCAVNTGDGAYKIKMALSGETLKGTFTDPGGRTGKVTATK